MSDPASSRVPAPIEMIDPGWLFLLAGIGILGATVLVPAFDQLADVRWQRDRALALEGQRLARLDRYQEYKDALDREEPSLVLALAASQLNQIPQNRTLILEPPDPASASASVFGALEPPPAAMPDRPQTGSILERWTTDERLRPWLIGVGGVCLLVGLMPKARAGEQEKQA